jgi:hypothetical protein
MYLFNLKSAADVYFEMVVAVFLRADEFTQF